MSLQDVLAIFAAFLAVAGVIFALGKQSQILLAISEDINDVGKKLDTHIERTDHRLDDLARFYVRVDQRVANLERQIFGDRMTELLRSGAGFADGEDDTIPL
jgi:hypothetical protein